MDHDRKITTVGMHIYIFVLWHLLNANFGIFLVCVCLKTSFRAPLHSETVLSKNGIPFV